ncbi:MAG: DNA polymerase Y family protein [Opitutaceae bacterium]
MFAVLHLADFALQAVLRTAAPAPHPRPTALIDPTDRPAVVRACTPAAREAGVQPGQTPAQALARCATLQIVSGNAAASAEAQSALMATAFSLSPAVEATAPGIGTLDLAGTAAEAREPVVRRALAQLAALGLHATAGLGGTPLLALYAARRAQPFLAVGSARDFLAPLRLADADPPAELAEILDGWGIRTLGDLTDLPKAALAQRLGPAGVALWERAAGETTRPLSLAVLPQVFVAVREGEEPMETIEPALFILRRFVDRLALELQTAGFAAVELILTLGLEDETSVTRSIRLPEPTAHADTLFRTLQTYLETVRTTAALSTFRLEVTPTRATARQRDIFDGALRDPYGFAETLARISALVGPDRVGTPVLENTHRPDAFRLVTPLAVLSCAAPISIHPPVGRPLRRFRPPQTATVELTGALPGYVWTEAFHGRVTALAGPWQAAGDWWQADLAWRREEWDVELEPAGIYRLVHTPVGWCVEGEYD